MWGGIHPIMSKRKFDVYDDFFDNIDTEEKAYFYGLWLSDGYITTSKAGEIGIDLHIKDIEILEAFAKALGGNRPLLKNAKGHPRLKWSSQHMRETFRRYKIPAQKSLLIKGPGCHIPDELFHHFFRGYVDGDGSWCIGSAGRKNKRKYLTLSVRATPSFCRYFKRRCPFPLNYGFSVTGILTTKRTESVFGFWHWMYDDATVFLKRKRDKLLEYVSGPVTDEVAKLNPR